MIFKNDKVFDFFPEDIVEYLINKGADINVVDEIGETPIYDAVSNSNLEMLMLLINLNKHRMFYMLQLLNSLSNCL